MSSNNFPTIEIPKLKHQTPAITKLVDKMTKQLTSIFDKCCHDLLKSHVKDYETIRRLNQYNVPQGAKFNEDKLVEEIKELIKPYRLSYICDYSECPIEYEIRLHKGNEIIARRFITVDFSTNEITYDLSEQVE